MSDTTDQSQPEHKSSRLRATPRWQTLGFMLLLSSGYVWHSPGPNEQTRLNLVYAIVFHGKLNVDEYRDNTIDMAFHSGHYYCDKAPGLSFVAVPAMWAIKPLWLNVLPTKPMRFFMTVYLPRLFAVSVPSAVFGVLLYLFLRRAGVGERYGLGLVLAYGMGTLVLPYSALFYGHQLGSILGFGAFMLLASSKTEQAKGGNFACAGLLSGCAVVVEYPMAAVALIMVGYLAATRRRGRPVVTFCGAALCPIAGLLLYNCSCFGTPLALGYTFEKLGRFRQHHLEGLVGLGLPRLKHLYDATFSPHRGVFFQSPFLLLAPFGWWRMARSERWRAEAIVSLVALVTFLVYVSTLWEESYARAPGHRHLVPVLPFLVLPLAFCPPPLRRWVIALALLSIVEMTLINFVEPRIPVEIPVPFVQSVLPRLAAGKLDYSWGTVMRLGGPMSGALYGLVQVVLAVLLFRGAEKPGLADGRTR